MSENTKIQWCDSTVNFWRGCDKVSPGCKNCYITTTIPFRMSGQKHGDPRVLSEGAFKMAMKLNRLPWVCDDCGTGNPENDWCLKCGTEHASFHRRRIFSLSLGDWLDPEVPIEWLAPMLDTIRQCDQVTWILCTKRPENFHSRVADASDFHFDQGDRNAAGWLYDWVWGRGNPPSNVWLLASVENQEMADKRIPELLRIPAVVRGLSLEPLLSDVNLGPWFCEETPRGYQILSRYYKGNEFDPTGSQPEHKLRLKKDPGIHWLIAGGESGKCSRPCSIESLRLIVAQGRAAHVATFVKQLGARPTENIFDQRGGYVGFQRPDGIRHPKGGDPAEWPEDLRVQEFPGA